MERKESQTSLDLREYITFLLAMTPTHILPALIFQRETRGSRSTELIASYFSILKFCPMKRRGRERWKGRRCPGRRELTVAENLSGTRLRAMHPPCIVSWGPQVSARPKSSTPSHKGGNWDPERPQFIVFSQTTEFSQQIHT